jgi:hypothetical protein
MYMHMTAIGCGSQERFIILSYIITILYYHYLMADIIVRYLFQRSSSIFVVESFVQGYRTHDNCSTLFIF